MKLKSVIKDKSIDHEVNGETGKFYPISPKILSDHLPTFKGLMAVGIRLMQAQPDMRRESHKSTTSASEVGSFTVVDPPETQVLEHLRKQREHDIETFLKELSKEELRLSLGRILADCVRDPDLMDADDATVLAWVNDRNLDFCTLTDLLVGAWRANMHCFGPFVQRVKELLAPKFQQILEELRQARTVTPVVDGPTTNSSSPSTTPSA